MSDDDDELKEKEIMRRSLTEAGFTPDQLAVVYLRIEHGMSILAIAEELNMTLAEVARLDDEARKRVEVARKKIAAEEFDVDVLRSKYSSTRH